MARLFNLENSQVERRGGEREREREEERERTYIHKYRHTWNFIYRGVCTDLDMHLCTCVSREQFVHLCIMCIHAGRHNVHIQLRADKVLYAQLYRLGRRMNSRLDWIVFACVNSDMRAEVCRGVFFCLCVCIRDGFTFVL